VTSQPDSNAAAAPSSVDTAPLCHGRFVPFRRLGSGSQAETFEAVDRADGRAVAIKRFDVHGASTWKDVELAEREARVLEQLHHSALPEYITHFEQGGALYLVMEKIDGKDLAQLAATGERLSLAELTRLVEMLADVFEYLHGRSPPILHRDIKPSNIVRRDDGRYALIDFGSVRDGLRPQGGSTVVGTFGFMAPEQFQGRALPASDLYGAGATLLTLLTGMTPDRLPHRGLEIDVRNALGPGFPLPWVELLERLVCADPDRRSVALKQLLPGLRSSAKWSSSARAGHDPQPSATATDEAAGSAAKSNVTPPQVVDWSLTSGANFPPIFIVILSIIRIVLYVALEVALPLLLTLLSGVFGRNLQRAAADVSRAGQTANRQLSNAIFQLSRSHSSGMSRRQRIRAMRGWKYPDPSFYQTPPIDPTRPAKRRVRVGNFEVELPPDNTPDVDPPNDRIRRKR
jgi:serine/threonine protein kinase